jgi:putative membrane protein insertion efficiency factor
MLKFIKYIDQKIAIIFIFFVHIYQKTISPRHLKNPAAQIIRGCKFYPSCSDYAILVLEKNGAFFGVPRILKRLIKCHPWAKGGIDMP